MQLAVGGVSEVASSYADAPFEELCDGLSQINALSCAVRASLVEFVAEVSVRSEWSLDAASFPDWLCWKLGVSRSEAKSLCVVGSRLSELPHCFEAFRSGTLSWERLVILCGFLSSSDDTTYATTAQNLSLAHLRRLGREYELGSVSDARSAHSARSLSFSLCRSGAGMSFRGLLGVDEALLIKNQLELRTGAHGIDAETGLYPSYEQSMADALCEVFSVVPSVGSGTSVDADRATIVVETTLADLALAVGGSGDDEAPSHGRGGDLEGRVRICGETLARLGCDARIQMVHLDDEGHIVGLGRMTRTIAPWLSRRLSKRDQGCRFPGCEARSWTHGHHMAEWTKDAGPTDLDNLITLCGRHHRYVHESKWKVIGNANDSVEFIRPDGRVYASLPPPLRPDVAAHFPELFPPGSLTGT